MFTAKLLRAGFSKKFIGSGLKLYQKLLTIPSGSTRSKCFFELLCIPVRTYCPGDPCDSRTKKSPSYKIEFDVIITRFNPDTWMKNTQK